MFVAACSKLFWLCLEGIAKSLNLVNSLGFMVADKCATSMMKIARGMLADYRASGPPFGTAVDVSRIIDTVHFMESSQSPHLQLCDLPLGSSES